MNRHTLEDELRGIVKRNSRAEPDVIAHEHKLAGDLGFDSLAFLMLIGDLEQKFQLVVPMEKVEEFRDISFGDLVGMVADRAGVE